MKSALDNLIETLERGAWRPKQAAPGPGWGRERANIAKLAQTENRVACGSPHCAGCYGVVPGVKIHPPTSSEEWKEWLLRWEPEGRVQ
jgi:hypothetical protein